MVKVIGKSLKPGELHTYSSGCLLTSIRCYEGYFNMVNDYQKFKVFIPTFIMCAIFIELIRTTWIFVFYSLFIIF
jgi:ApaG protein